MCHALHQHTLHNMSTSRARAPAARPAARNTKHDLMVCRSLRQPGLNSSEGPGPSAGGDERPSRAHASTAQRRQVLLLSAAPLLGLVPGDLGQALRGELALWGQVVWDVSGKLFAMPVPCAWAVSALHALHALHARRGGAESACPSRVHCTTQEHSLPQCAYELGLVG